MQGQSVRYNTTMTAFTYSWYRDATSLSLGCFGIERYDALYRLSREGVACWTCSLTDVVID